MRANKITQCAQDVERKLRDVHKGQSRGAPLGHPRWQQCSATVKAIHYEMDHPCMDKASNDLDPPTSKRVMRIFDDNLEKVFLGGMSLA